ncbi:MAG: glycosyltransferase family 2 protein [Burkholderiales bacterium]|nr:glycosyltransferase family 2 protein [Burkholderiales bacterium]
MRIFSDTKDDATQALRTPPPPKDPAPVTVEPAQGHSGHYFSVHWKFALALLVAALWTGFSVVMAQAWVRDLTVVVGAVPAHLAIYGIAIIPGFMNAFLVASLVLDKRPIFKADLPPLPAITILVAAYNEAQNIAATVQSIALQQYAGGLQVIVINDGSTDATAEVLAGLDYPWLEVINLEHNAGKANALNLGLSHAKHALTITVDGDSYLYRNALHHLVSRYLSDPPNTRAVAGAVLVRNSRKNMVTAMQEWDYFHGIAAIKRLQSLYQGTLVAQGAFSIYDTETVRAVGGWQHTVGEDIVLTWAILERGYRVGFAENACLFTDAPDTWRQFIRQRQRWARGLVEAFKAHGRLLFKARMTTLFIWWDLLFPYLDLVYSMVFVPGLVLALFGVYWIAGPMTLLVLPLTLLVNYLMYRIQTKMFTEEGLHVRRNILGFVFYAQFYSVVLQPACVVGYVQELVSRTKNWGTK